MTTKAQRMMNIGDTVNVGETERIVSAIVGGALTIWGLSRLSLADCSSPASAPRSAIAPSRATAPSTRSSGSTPAARIATSATSA